MISLKLSLWISHRLDITPSFLLFCQVVQQQWRSSWLSCSPCSS
jgi:hypothetical protein